MNRAISARGQEEWQDLLTLASVDDRERAVVESLIERQREEADCAGVGLYVRVGQHWEREAEVGKSFPATLSDEEINGRSALRLAGARLIFADEERLPPPAGPLGVALASAVRALVLRRQLKQHSFEMKYRGVELEALYDVGLAIASTLNLEELGEEILLRAVSLLDVRRGALYLTESGNYRLAHTFGGAARAELAADDPLVSRLVESATAAQQDLLPGAEEVLAVPVESDRDRRGLLVVGDKETRHGLASFGASDRRTLSLFANQAAIALENAKLHKEALEKERLESELELAADIQRQLLPTALPQLGGFEIAGWNRPARHVGGDYYNAVMTGTRSLGLVLGDVAGKGMPAALLVSTLHSALRVLLDRDPIGPELVSSLNHHVHESSGPNKFITLALAEVDGATGAVKCINAGHNPLLLVRKSGGTDLLPAGGLPLGLFPDASYRVQELVVEAGDLLCFYSDGITECESPAEEEFGESRLGELLTAMRDRPLSELVCAVDDRVTSFAQGQPQADDQTLLLLRRNA